MAEPHTPPYKVGRKAASPIIAGIIHADIAERFRHVDKSAAASNHPFGQRARQ